MMVYHDHYPQNQRFLLCLFKKRNLKLRMNIFKTLAEQGWSYPVSMPV